MTIYVDPVIGAALVHLGLPILPALPCPTCRGTGWRCRNSNLMCTHRVHQGCEDCTGSGVWTPPDSPVPIGVTSAEPNRKVHPMAWRDDEGWWLYEPTERRRAAIVLSSMIGEGTLRKVKVVEADADGHGAVVEMRPDGSLWFWPEGAFGEDAATDISSALPFLPGLKPGDTVYLLDGFTESVECPEWHDSTPEDVINEVERRLRDEEWSSRASDRCRTALLHIDAYREGKARSQSVGRLSCPFPVAAPDHPCAQP
jgi:hypothetical protein